ncbi:MAG TPA: divalent metal cation transporter [Terriglobales bacterium]|nr:divalent metal cation transporter [Terriglobales bacterium]
MDPNHSPEEPRRRTSDALGRVLKFPRPPAPASRTTQPASWWSTLWRIGPGVVTGSSNLDPSAVVTATVVGAAFSYSLLWVVVLCIPLLLNLLSVTARIGVETGQGVLDLLRSAYGRRMALIAAIMTILVNAAVVIADLMAVSDVLSVLTGQPRLLFVAAAAFSVWYILVFQDYRKITRVLVLVSLPLYLYVAAAVVAAPPLRVLLWNTFVPHFHNPSHLAAGIVAVFGSFLTPYIVLWQTSSRTDPQHEPDKSDSRAATLVTFLLAYSVMVAAASVLHLRQPVDMTTRQAAEALRPVVGDWGTALFSLGIIGSGMVALPVLVASMCYDLAQAIGWKYGLSESPWEAKGFYVLISATMIVASLANYLPINPVRALYWSMILAGLLTVPIFWFILVVSNDRRIMHTTNTVWENFWIGAAAGGSGAATLALIWTSMVH